MPPRPAERLTPPRLEPDPSSPQPAAAARSAAVMLGGVTLGWGLSAAAPAAEAAPASLEPDTTAHDSAGAALSPLWSSSHEGRDDVDTVHTPPPSDSDPSDLRQDEEALPVVPQIRTARAADRVAEGTVTVRSGESLWSITGELLGPDAADDQIARHWPALWAANADQIADPDSLDPGTVLRLPESLQPGAGQPHQPVSD